MTHWSILAIISAEMIIKRKSCVMLQVHILTYEAFNASGVYPCYVDGLAVTGQTGCRECSFDKKHQKDPGLFLPRAAIILSSCCWKPKRSWKTNRLVIIISHQDGRGSWSLGLKRKREGGRHFLYPWWSVVQPGSGLFLWNCHHHST